MEQYLHWQQNKNRKSISVLLFMTNYDSAPLIDLMGLNRWSEKRLEW